MLAIQLDHFLGGHPVQHRQVQGYETPEFMSLFPAGLSYKVSYTEEDMLDPFFPFLWGRNDMKPKENRSGCFNSPS